jgi:DNA-binding NarL/FixJ family response regulator
MRKRILILDDHPAVRSGLFKLINREPDLMVCSGIGETSPLWELIESSRPDLMIVDLKLKDGNGIDVIREAKSRYPRLPILAVSILDETQYALQVIEAGGRGYVMKQDVSERVLTAIRRILGGEIYLSERVSKQVGLANLAKNHILS